MPRCEMCGMDVNEQLTSKKDINGKEYWFCSGMCEMKFLKIQEKR